MGWIWFPPCIPHPQAGLSAPVLAGNGACPKEDLSTLLGWRWGDTGDISCGTCVVLKAASLEDIQHVDFYESPPLVGPELEQPT